MSVDIARTVEVYISALNDLGATPEAQRDMGESAKSFLTRRQERQNFQDLINAAVRHLGPSPLLLTKLNLISTMIKCHVVVVRGTRDDPSLLFVVHTLSDAFVISTNSRDSDVQVALDTHSLRLVLHNAELDELPKDIVDPPSVLWAGAMMEMLLSEMVRFITRAQT
ncbi:hypothetical protein B0H14DRAFT_309381 [Mycena olivaceomarginata]|nr:hypothetical protein B0H14DRAFT_309381 [Mycena olivaceomarginata]